MPRRSRTVVDPVFAEIAKAIYGDDVDPREIAKFSPGGPELSTPGSPMTMKQAKDQQRVAAIGLGATGIAGIAGIHAISATRKENAVRTAAAGASAGRHAAEEAEPVGRAAGALTRVARLKPTTAAKVIGGAALGLHAVELVGDTLGAHAQVKALKQANANSATATPAVSKAFRLKPLNPSMAIRVPSLRAKRVARNPLSKGIGATLRRVPKPAKLTGEAALQAGEARHAASVTLKSGPNPNPMRSAKWWAEALAEPKPVSKGIIRNIRQTTKNVEAATSNANRAAAEAAEAAARVKHLIPKPKTAVAVTAAHLGILGGASYAGSYVAGRKRAKLAPVSKAAQPTEVTWQGLISKIDPERRQVFGWASVSRINGEEVVDLQGDVVPIDEIEKSAYQYVLESRKGGDMHKRVSKFSGDQPLHTADMIESFVVTPEKLEKMGLAADALPHGWWVGYKVNDDKQWEMVKSGERAGFSIHGSGTRTPAGMASVRKSLGTPLERVSSTFEKVSAAYPDRVAPHPLGAKGPHPADVYQNAVLHHRAALRDAHDAGHSVHEMFTAIGADKLPSTTHALVHHKIQNDLGVRRGLEVLGLQRRGSTAGRDLVKDIHGREIAPIAKAHPIDVLPQSDNDDLIPVARKAKPKLKVRAGQALRPPPVNRDRVQSAAIRTMGYQKQTHRLAVEMQSRPGRPYVYRVSPGEGHGAMHSQSKGKYYNEHIRNQATHARHFTPADRVRLFAHPQEN